MNVLPQVYLWWGGGGGLGMRGGGGPGVVEGGRRRRAPLSPTGAEVMMMRGVGTNWIFKSRDPPEGRDYFLSIC